MKAQIKHLASIYSLHKILELSFDAEDSYEQLKANAQDRNLVNLLNVKQEQTTGFIMEILTLLQHLNIPPKSNYTIKSKFNKIRLDLKMNSTQVDDTLIINECHKIDNLIMDTLKKHAKSGFITSNISSLYVAHLNQLHTRLRPLESHATFNIS